MPKYTEGKNTASHISELYIQDSITGLGASGLIFNTAGLQCSYHRNTSATAIQLILQSGIVGTFVPSGFVEVDRVKLPGFYQLCLPNEAYLTGAGKISAMLQCSGIMPVPIEIQLIDATLGYIATSGITSLSYSLQSELSTPPSFPVNPMDMWLWIFERSFHKNSTTSLADYIYKNNGTAVLASGQVSDDSTTFIREKYQ